MSEPAQNDNSELPNGRNCRRLSDKILTAFHCACDRQDLETARKLLGVFEFMARRNISKERRSCEGLVAAHERLWDLRHPEPEPDHAVVGAVQEKPTLWPP